MKYLVALFILFFCTLQTFGQQEYFIYLQTENSQAFYIRIKDTVHSSTASGYLILSKLPDSTTNITIGFAKSVYPEQQFNIPVNRKDAGYLIKNFGDKGWGLFNLQTLAVLMNSNPPEEKKSPEITGDRKNDPFSLLLANAVNDTAVLYTVAKPKKPVTVAVVQPEEKKKDTVRATEDLVKKESAEAERQIMAAADSAIAVQRRKDSLAAKTVAVTTAKNNKPQHDSSIVAKTVTPTPAPGKNAVVKSPPLTTGKNISKPRKDSIVIINNPPAGKNAVAKNTSARKDTIIIMNSKPPAGNGAVAKNTAANKPPATKPVEIKKEILPLQKKDTLVKAEEKAIALNNPPNLPAPTTTIKKDSVVNPPVVLKDSVNTAITKTAVDTPAIAVKRTGPLVTKAAELFTDTSYVAVFVDESKEVFDTVRISIPFNEILLRAGQPVAANKETMLPANSKDSSKLAQATVAVKNDTTAKPVNDSSKHIQAAVPVKNDAAAKPVKDSSIVKTDTAAKDTVTSKPVTNAVPPPVQPVKKDTGIPEIADSGRVLQPPKQTVMLNSDCKEIAWDSDIDKLRIKMLVVTEDDEKITLAKKVYRQKCFSVKQVRALSELFKTDEGKYKWFDAVYPFVSDSANFSSLGEQIKGDYYLNRFKAMLRN